MAQTIIFNVSQDTTWTSSGNPYFLKSDIKVDSGAILTIEPGVKVFGDKNKLITVFGRIIIQGAKSDSVYFNANHTQPEFNNFGGIRIMPRASAEVYYCKASYAKRFLSFEINSTGSVYDSYLDHHQTALTADSLTYVRVSNTIFTSNDMGMDSIFPGYVNSCLFLNNFFGVNYSNGTTFSACTFKNNSEIGLAGKYGRLSGNLFLSNNIGLEYYLSENRLVYAPSEITKNRFEKNVIGFKVTGSLPTGKFKNNYLCNNGLFSIYNNTAYNPDLSENCWCGQDSIQIRNKIYDLYTDISRKVGIVKFIPFSDSCSTFLQKYSISGQSVSNSSMHQVWLYKNDNGQEHLIRKVVTGSAFTFNNLEDGIYKVLSVALNNDSSENNEYLPSYYFKKLSIANAVPLKLDGNIFSVDVELLQNSLQSSSSESHFHLDTDLNKENIIYLEEENGYKVWRKVVGKQFFSVPFTTGKYKIRIISDEGEFNSSLYDLQINKSYTITQLNKTVIVNASLAITIPDTLNTTAIKVLQNRNLNSILIFSESPLENANILVFNSSAVKIFESTFSGFQNELSTATWPGGFYILRIMHNSQKIVFNLIKD